MKCPICKKDIDKENRSPPNMFTFTFGDVSKIVCKRCFDKEIERQSGKMDKFMAGIKVEWDAKHDKFRFRRRVKWGVTAKKRS